MKTPNRALEARRSLRISTLASRPWQRSAGTRWRLWHCYSWPGQWPQKMRQPSSPSLRGRSFPKGRSSSGARCTSSTMLLRRFSDLGMTAAFKPFGSERAVVRTDSFKRRPGCLSLATTAGWVSEGGGILELGQLESQSDYAKYQGRSFTLPMADECGQHQVMSGKRRLAETHRNDAVKSNIAAARPPIVVYHDGHKLRQCGTCMDLLLVICSICEHRRFASEWGPGIHADLSPNRLTIMSRFMRAVETCPS